MKKKQIINWTSVLIKASKDIEKYPPFILRDKYNFTQANFYNLCNRFPKLREINNNFNKNYLNDERSFNYIKYLITDILKLKIDDTLPRKIGGKKIFIGQYWSIYEYALKRIAKDSYWKNFSAASFLICGAFPNIYLPFQFQKSNKFNYFNSKKNIIKSMIEIFKLKTNINLEEDDIDSDLKYSLIMDRSGIFSSPNMQLYGIQRKFWSKTFSTKNLKDVRIAISEYLELNKLQQRDTTKKLIQTLKKNKVNVGKCGACAETRRLEIHHIINVQDSHLLTGDDNINDYKNLIPLCVYHHDDARNIKLNDHYKKNGFKNIKTTLLKKLLS